MRDSTETCNVEKHILLYLIFKIDPWLQSFVYYVSLLCKQWTEISERIGSLSFYSKISCLWLFVSPILEGFIRSNPLAINIQLKRKDENITFSNFAKDVFLQFFVI